MDKLKFQQLSVSTTSSFNRVNRWEKVVIPGPLPPRRSYHSVVTLGNRLLIFGGQDLADGLLSDVWALSLQGDSQEDMWQKLEPTGEAPGFLCRHKAVYDGHKMYVIGGTGKSSESTSIYTLDTQAMHWEAVHDATPSIDSHSATLEPDSQTVVVFGGYVNTKRSDKTHLYHLQTGIWESLECEVAPAARVDHSAVLYKGSVYVFGGLGRDSTRLNDLWKFKDRQWEEVRFQGEVPDPVSGHSACVNNTQMIVFGGIRNIFCESNSLFAYDFEEGVWTQLQNDQALEDPVSAVQLQEYEQTHRSGSPPKSRRLRHLYEGPPQPTKGRVRGKFPSARDGHSASLIDGMMYIFGGDRHHMPYNDIHSYALS